MTEAKDWLTGGSRRDAAETRIRAAARSLLVDRGVDSFTADAVARRAGCSRATLYRITGGSKALLDAVVADASVSVLGQIEARTTGLDGAARVVEAVLAAVDAIRADAALREWLAHRRTAGADDYFGSSTAMAQTAQLLGGVEADGPLAGPWLVRVVLSLVTWPLADANDERDLVERFVLPAFRPEG
ncbi:TetR/AcrR family transcriptional regulator [Nocardioides humilatus]|uniref:TetR/AcrR family transcriptional regulator n=1 Tax=Nocardioides humilatus TaxID=2607660 RepID=UPI001CB6D462|nr:TetR/AcrR family transcriptional regulator [Nocardioides humilatus]